MATPTLNIINSYSVDDGVTLTFDANYGTNLVRGSVLTIMDMNDKVLAWHIYIPDTYTTASTTHVLPSKTALLNESVTPNAYNDTTSYVIDDIVAYNGSTYKCVKANTGNAPDTSDSWVLLGNVVGKFSYVSTNFLTHYINEKQYQYTIQTFVSYQSDLTLNGKSGDSNKVSAWVLPTPTIDIDTIGINNVIETTSYTIGITYSTNIQTSIINQVYNPIKTIEFELQTWKGNEWITYKKSDVLYNSGTLLLDGVYYLNYTFNGMTNGDSYRVVANATSILGMTTSGVSNTFVVNAKTYQLDAFSVDGDSCNGRIEIKSNIINIEGESSTTPQEGEIDLGNEDWCKWGDGLAFTNNWTARFWVYDITIADEIPSTQYIVRFKSKITNGIIEIYAIQDASNENNCKLGLYVYPTGYESSVPTYLESNSVPISSVTQANPLCIAVGFDYDNSGSYFIKAIT